MLADKKQLAGHGRHHNSSEAIHRRSTGTRGCCPEKRNGQWREKILLNIILNYMYLKTFQLPGGTERASTQTILFAALQNSQHCRKVPLWFHYKKNWLWGIRKKMIFQTRPRLNMKNKRKRLSFKLDQAGLKTIRDPAWACKHAQQSQYKHPATAFSLASWILDIHSHSAKCITSLSEKASRKFQAPKQLDAKKNVCSANARTKRRSESLLHLSSQVSDQLFNLFCFIFVVLLSSMWCWLYCPLLQKNININMRHHSLSECFFFLQWKTITLFVIVQILVFTQCLTTCFCYELNSIAIGSTKIFLVSKCSKKEWLDVQPGQVQNLTPQLVNAGTIKMTYPENKVAMIIVMLMVVVMMLMMVFFEDPISKISVPNGDDQSW